MQFSERAVDSIGEEKENFIKKHTQEIAMILTLGVGSQFLHDQRVEEPKPECKIHNREELEKRFLIEVVGGNKDGDVTYLIGQFHGLGNLADMNAMPVIKRVVAKAQRTTGEALVILGAEEAFVEGITKELEEYFGIGSKEIIQFRGLIEAGEIDSALALVSRRIDKFRLDMEAGRLIDYKIAFEEMFILERLNEIFSHKDFDKFKVSNKGLLVTLSKTREILQKAPHLEEGGYEWGAVYVLWAQGKIRIRAGEEKSLYLKNLELNKKISQYRNLHGVYAEEDLLAFKDISTKREDAALRLTFRDRKKRGGDVRVIIFGNAHDFFENFKRFELDGLTQGLGFAQLQDKNQQEYEKEVAAAHQMIEGPSIKDARESH